MVTLPGETYAAGTAAGKTGTASALTAGATVLATVRAVDAWSNAITTTTPTVAVSASDTAAVLLQLPGPGAILAAGSAPLR